MHRSHFPALLAFLLLIVAGSLLLNGAAGPAAAASDLTIYGDTLASGWADWSWNSTRNFGNPSPVQSGSTSIAVTYTLGWGGLSLRAPAPIGASGYSAIAFWAYGGAGGAPLRLNTYATDGGGASSNYDFTAPAGVWTHYTVTLSALGDPAAIARVNFQDRSGGAQPTFYLDNIVLVGDSGPPPSTPPPGVGPALTVNAISGVHPISPFVYGLNFADEALADELNLPVNRWGGNATTRYNWQTDISNHASDWYFENIKESSATNPPADSAAIRFIEQNRRTGTQTLLTVPTIGYVSNSSATACGFSIAKYGGQTGSDWQWRPDCGNGILTGGVPITGNNPLDTSAVITQSFVANWVSYLSGRYGNAASGGVRFYNLDNEPGIWHETHRDVHPQPFTYDESYTRTVAYATAIKQADPTALVLGPVQDGWTRYWYASYLSQSQAEADRNAHGGVYFIPWYLQQLKTYNDQQGVRLLDYLDLHYYPQAGGAALSPAGNATTQTLRLRSTRSLWDATYQDESWIAGAGPDGGIVRLIPRMKEWVSANYPGTKLAIGEYNWGALDHINGALAQADVLGIFGREGLDLATLWGPPSANEPGAFAFRMYRNYDGAGSAFGETSVHAHSGDQEKLAIYAATRAGDGALTLMVINKTTGALTSTVTLSGFTPAINAAVFRYSTASLNAIVAQPPQSVAPNGFTAAFPANSITLIVIPTGVPLNEKVYLPLVRR
jgi:hypothetical protein